MSQVSRNATQLAAFLAFGFVAWKLVCKTIQSISTEETSQHEIRNIDTIKDRDSLKIVGKETFPDAIEELWDNPVEYIQFLDKFITTKYSFVATVKLNENQERIIGFCFITLQPENFENNETWHKIPSLNNSVDSIEIALIGVASDFRRKNIGYQLLMSSINSLRKDINSSNMKEFCLDLHLRESNIAAMKLYTKIGFVVSGPTITEFYDNPPEDAIYMKMTL